MRVLLKLTWIEIKLLAREPVTLLFSFAFPVLVLVLLGGIFGDQHMKMGAYKGVKMMNWYVPIEAITRPMKAGTYQSIIFTPW